MALHSRTIIDLTHALSVEQPTWDGDCGFEIQTLLELEQCNGATQFKLQAVDFKKIGIGTHIDAPSHCFAHGSSVADLPLEKLITKACVIDVSHKAHSRYALLPEDILEFEERHGVIEPNSLVIAYTGWSKFWHSKDAYRNINKQGFMEFPIFSLAAATLLTDRTIAGIAIDTLSPDSPNGDFPVHRLLLGSGKYIIENIANAHLLPPVGALICALPLKMQITESPVRIVALIGE